MDNTWSDSVSSIALDGATALSLLKFLNFCRGCRQQTHFENPAQIFFYKGWPVWVAGMRDRVRGDRGGCHRRLGEGDENAFGEMAKQQLYF